LPAEVLYYWWNSKKKQPLHKEKAVGPGLLTLALLADNNKTINICQMDPSDTYMKRVIGYVDGFTLYFGLKSKGWGRD